MNRKKLISLINDSESKLLKDEIGYFLETSKDEVGAFDDAYTFAEENNERKLLKEMRLILIEAGYLIEQPEKTDFGRDTRIIVNKVKYQVVKHWDGWINE